MVLVPGACRVTPQPRPDNTSDFIPEAVAVRAEQVLAEGTATRSLLTSSISCWRPSTSLLERTPPWPLRPGSCRRSPGSSSGGPGQRGAHEPASRPNHCKAGPLGDSVSSRKLVRYRPCAGRRHWLQIPENQATVAVLQIRALPVAAVHELAMAHSRVS